MIVDTSAVIAIVFEEKDALQYVHAIDQAATASMSAASYFEAGIVVDGSRDPVLSGRFDDIIAAAEIVITPVTEEQAKRARAAYRDFGRGSGHRASLNFGDCFAYALARMTGEALLFKGDDFIHTDVIPALQ